MLEFDRKDLAEMRADELAPLEALMAPEWPDTWRELATSQFVTLLSAPGAGQVAPAALADEVIDALAAQLSAAFDRAALAIARGEPAEPQRQAMRWLLTQLVQGAGAAPRA